MILIVNTLTYLSSATILVLATSLASAITLDEALTEAQSHNRQIRISGTRIEQKQEELAAQKTRRMPVTSTQATAGISLLKTNVTFPRGAFGDYAGTGPIPGEDTKVGLPRQFSGFAYSSISLPLTQQIRVGAAIEGARLDVSLAGTDCARTEQEVAAQVRQLYFGLLSAEAAVKAAQSNLELAREVERLAKQGVDAGTVLPADSGEATARRLRADTAVNGVRMDRENLKEQFNLLVGRNLDEPVEVTQPDVAASDLTAEVARQQASAKRPEVEAARLRIRQAETAVRGKKAELIPDVSLTLQHFGFLNTGNIAPSNYAVAGVSLTWEPWDWGRRRKEAHALQYQAEAAKLALDDTTQQVQRQASQALRAWEQSQREIAAAEAAVTAAQESMRVTRQRVEQQVALMRQLLEAQTTFETAQEQQVRAIAARGTAWANLQLATGTK